MSPYTFEYRILIHKTPAWLLIELQEQLHSARHSCFYHCLSGVFSFTKEPWVSQHGLVLCFNDWLSDRLTASKLGTFFLCKADHSHCKARDV